MRLKKKRVASIKDSVQKPAKPEVLVVEDFPGTLSAAKACLLFPKQGIIMRCNVDQSGVIVAMLQLILMLV